MKTQSINYLEERGLVGQYKGQDIFIIDEKDFSVPLSKKEKKTVFAIIYPDKEVMTLVNRGMIIGEMTFEGRFIFYEKSSFYEGNIQDREMSLPASAEDVFAANISSSGIDPTEKYISGEDLKDRFLRRIGEW